MSDVIRLLPDAVANQIAAGEVIQRPSSVVKELVENALDAGATKIQVIVTDAGKTCLQVIDNGRGMSETDARLAFERHATSKISEAADLFTLRTMGFRGEALASIAAVAQVELRTRMAEQEVGVSLVIEGSKVKEQQPISCPVGANFSVRNLFFNIPARRKFLKSNQTELSNIVSEMERVALAHPDIAFVLNSGDTSILNLQPGNCKQRILGVFGKKLDAHLIPVQVETTLVNVKGFVGSPKSARKKGAPQFFFVNGRYMRHPYFNKAVISAYDRLLPEGEQAPYFLYFEIDPARIDVNIHPQKTEIKFEDEPSVWPILLAAVREALGKSNAVPTIDFDTENQPDIPMFPTSFREVQPPVVPVDLNFNPFEKKRGPVTTNSRGNTSSVFSSTPKNTDWQTVYEHALVNPELPLELTSVETQPYLYSELPLDQQQDWDKENASYFQYLGRFVISNTSEGILIVDLHRAHIRILYDQFRKQLEEKRGMTQGMLFPQLLQLPSSAALVLEEMIQDLQYVGFDLSPLGNAAFSILGIPAGTEGLDPVVLLQSLVEDAITGEVKVKEQIHHHIASSLAKKAAIPVGQVLGKAEMADLLDRLFQSSNANFTPEGAVILTVLNNDKIERLFD